MVFTARIPLGNSLLYAVVDWKDYRQVEAHKWWLKVSRRSNYAYTRIQRKNVSMHRFITGAEKGELVDHWDGDGLNNRRGNLRKTDVTRNNRNRTNIAKNNTSGFTGLHLIRKTGYWSARLGVSGRHVHLGSYASRDEAAAVRRAAEVILFGEFAPVHSSAPTKYVGKFSTVEELVATVHVPHKPGPGLSGYRGVRPQGKKWKAICYPNMYLKNANGKRLILSAGPFDTPEEAAAAYEQLKAERDHGRAQL